MLFLRRLFAFPLTSSGRSSGSSTPYCAISFCSFVGLGFLVLLDSWNSGGGSVVTWHHLCSSCLKKLVSVTRNTSAPSSFRR